MNVLKLFQSFRFGFAGLLHLLKTEQNARIHLLAVVVVVAAGVFFQISAGEWAAVVFCIGLVLSSECANTALERLADRVSGEEDPLIRQAKDSAAAAVLVAALMSLVIGGIVFVPKVIQWISSQA